MENERELSKVLQNMDIGVNPKDLYRTSQWGEDVRKFSKGEGPAPWQTNRADIGYGNNALEKQQILDFLKNAAARLPENDTPVFGFAEIQTPDGLTRYVIGSSGKPNDPGPELLNEMWDEGMKNFTPGLKDRCILVENKARARELFNKGCDSVGVPQSVENLTCLECHIFSAAAEHAPRRTIIKDLYTFQIKENKIELQNNPCANCQDYAPAYEQYLSAKGKILRTGIPSELFKKVSQQYKKNVAKETLAENTQTKKASAQSSEQKEQNKIQNISALKSMETRLKELASELKQARMTEDKDPNQKKANLIKEEYHSILHGYHEKRQDHIRKGKLTEEDLNSHVGDLEKEYQRKKHTLS